MPQETTEDDTEGHRYSTSDRNVKHDVQPVVSDESPEGDDTEGHGTLRGSALPADDSEVEGHGAYSGRALPEDEDGTEGHGVSSNRIAPDQDDTEGHAIGSGRALPDDEMEDPDDTEGHTGDHRF